MLKSSDLENELLLSLFSNDEYFNNPEIVSYFAGDNSGNKFYRNAALVAGRFNFSTNSSFGGFDFFRAVSDVVTAPVKVVRDISKTVSHEVKKVPGIGNTLSQITDIQGHLQTVSRVITDAKSLVKNVPVIGDPLSKMINVPGLTALNQIMENKRLDEALINDFKKVVDSYAGQIVLASKFVAFVPGVGTGVAAGIGASAALIEGKPIDAAFIEAVKSAIPGGAIAAAAFEIGKNVIEKKSVDPIDLAFSVAKAAGVNIPQEDLVKASLNIVKTGIEKKKIDPLQLLQAAGKVKGIKIPDTVTKAFTVGVAIANAKNVQGEILNQISKITPTDISKITALGDAFIKKAPQFKQAGYIIKSLAERNGFRFGAGIMSISGQNENTIKSFRNKLPPAQRKGFDLAVSARIGSTTKPVPKAVKYTDFAKKSVVKKSTVTKSVAKKAVTVKPVVKKSVTTSNKVVPIKQPITPVIEQETIAEVIPIKKSTKDLSPTKQEALKEFAYFATEGMSGAPSRIEQMETLASDPVSREGAIIGVKTIAERRKSVWQRLKEYFGFHGETIVIGEFI
jgi:hypothetical protein